MKSYHPSTPRAALPALFRILAAVSLGLALAAAAFAAEARKSFDVPAGDAIATLKQFMAQADTRLLYSVEAVKSVQTNAVKGDLTPREALDRMIEGTGLEVSQNTKDGALAVNRAASPNAPRAIAQNSDRPEQTGKIEKNAAGESVIKLETFEVLGTKLLNMDIPRSRDDAQPYVVFNREQLAMSPATNLEDFLRNKLTMNTQGGSYSQFDGQEGNASQINLRGLGTNQTLILIDGQRVASSNRLGPAQPDINGIPLAAVERIEVLPSTASGIYGGSATGGVVNIILRRDYVGSEITATYQNTFSTDAANRRIDLSAGFATKSGKTNVLLSASYSDATALVNRDRSFFQERMVRAFTNNPALIQPPAAPALGYTTNIQSAATVYSPVPAGTPGSFNVPLGYYDPSFTTAPTTIDKPNLLGVTAPLVLKNGTPLNSFITFIPVGYAGAASDGGAALVANAGKYNLNLADSLQLAPGRIGSGGGRAFLTMPTVKSITATVRSRLTANIEAFLDTSAAMNYSEFLYSGFTFPKIVSASAPNNPFTGDISVMFPTPGLVSKVAAASSQYRAVGGVIVKLPAGWQVEANYNWSKARYFYQAAPIATFNTLTAGIQNGSIDVLKDLNKYRIDWAPLLPPSSVAGTFITPQQTILRDISLRAAGNLATLPGGNVSLSSLLETRNEAFSDGYNGVAAYKPAAEQAIGSAYLESNVPIIGDGNRLPWLHSAQLQLSGRHDEYKVVGATSSVNKGSEATVVRRTLRLESTNPTVGLLLQPTEDITFRASYGTGFLPPTVFQLVPRAPTSTFSTDADPRRGNTGVGALNTVGGGNPNLAPEKSTSQSYGLIVTPKALPGLRLSVDYTKIHKTDNIYTPISYFQVFAIETLVPGLVTRGPNLPTDLPGWAGPVTQVNFVPVNIALAKVEAWDVALTYLWKSPTLGSLEGNFNATWQTHYTTQVVPGQPLVEQVGIGDFGNSNPLKFKGNVGLTWKRGPWTADWSATYYDSYLVSRNPTVILSQGGNGRVPSQVYHDVAFTYNFGTSRDGGRWRSMLHDTRLTLGVSNIFNAAPPYDAAQGFYYSPYGSPLMARYLISLKRAF